MSKRKVCKHRTKENFCDLTKNWTREFGEDGEPLNNYYYEYCEPEDCVQKRFKRDKVSVRKEPAYTYITIDLPENLYFAMLRICYLTRTTLDEFALTAIEAEIKRYKKDKVEV